MAKLTGLKVGNFKAFGPTQNVPIRPITLIFGPNSGGKSSIIHSLALLSSGLDAQRTYGWDVHKTRLGGDAIDLGGFWNYLHRPNMSDSVVIGAEHSLGDTLGGDINHPGHLNASMALEIGPCEEGLGQAKIFDIRKIFFSEGGSPSIELTRYFHEGSDYQSEKAGITFSLSSFNPDSELWQRVLRDVGEKIMREFADRLEPGSPPWEWKDEAWFGAMLKFDWADYISTILNEDNFVHIFGLLGNTFSHHSSNFLREPKVDEELRRLLDEGSKERRKHSEKLRELEEKYRQLENELPEISRKLAELEFEEEDSLIQERRIQLKAELGQWEKEREDLYWSIQDLSRFTPDDSIVLEADRRAMDDWMKKEHVDYGSPTWLRESKFLRAPLFRQQTAAVLGKCLVKEINEIFSAMTCTFSLEEQFSSPDSDHNSSGPNITYLGPLRTYPERHLYESNIQVIGDKRSGHHEWMSLFSKISTLEDLNILLGADFLKSEYQIGIQEYTPGNSTFVPPNRADSQSNSSQGPAVEKIRELKIYNKTTGIELSNRDIGLGISQVLPVLISLSSNQNKVIAIEQPELHLHPAMQASLGDVFIRSVLQTGQSKEDTDPSERKVTPGHDPENIQLELLNENQNTVILETHSEHLILRILRRIRQTSDGTLPKHLPAIRPQDVAVLYVKPEAEGARVIQIPINDQGEFEEPWPGGFFPERLEEYLE